MNVELADSDEEIQAAFDAMKHLRDLPSAEAFLTRVRELQQDGFLLAVLRDRGSVVAAAGFRIGNKLAWGRHVYVDDLVTVPEARSNGYGKVLLSWLIDYARSHECGQLHLDSGAQRLDAHRFYRREGLEAASVHFRRTL
jgi:GNAT superfamily N-acetyltransferase